MTEYIKFEEEQFTDPRTKKQADAVRVIRNGKQVARLPEADRLRRALALSVAEVEDVVNNFPAIMGRQPNDNESAFWKAVLDYKYYHTKAEE